MTIAPWDKRFAVVSVFEGFQGINSYAGTDPDITATFQKIADKFGIKITQYYSTVQKGSHIILQYEAAGLKGPNDRIDNYEVTFELAPGYRVHSVNAYAYEDPDDDNIIWDKNVFPKKTEWEKEEY